MTIPEAEPRPTRSPRSGRGTGRNAAAVTRDAVTRDEDLDLLTAALLGLAAGVGVTLLLRRGRSGRRPLLSGMDVASRGARLANLAGIGGGKRSRRGFARGVRGAQHGIERGIEWAEELPINDIGGHVRDYFEAAKEAIEDTVSGELQDLRKSIRRKRRQIGI